MKNINTNLLFANGENLLIEDGTPEFPVTKCSDTLFKLEGLKVIISLNALHKKGELGKENDFKFDRKYRLIVRLTELSSGSFVDIFNTILNPNVEYLDLCRLVFDKKFVLQIDNVLIDTKCKKEKFETRDSNNICVIKLILVEDEIYKNDPNAVLTVQSIHPFKIIKDI